MSVQEELAQHLKISQRNLNAIQQKQKEISSAIALLNDDFTSHLTTFTRCSSVHTQFFKADKHTQEQKVMLHTINNEIARKEKCVKLLKETSQLLNVKVKDLKNAQQEKTDYSEMKMLKRALNKFTSVYQYDIDTIVSEESNSYTIVIKFIFYGKVSQHPLQFIIDRETDKITDVKVGILLSNVQLDKLLERFNQTNNCLALFCCLRNAALKKHLN